jgi:hypothetical protein
MFFFILFFFFSRRIVSAVAGRLNHANLRGWQTSDPARGLSGGGSRGFVALFSSPVSFLSSPGHCWSVALAT